MVTNQQRRGSAIIKAIQEMQEILSQRDKHEFLGEMLRKLAPEQVSEIKVQQNIPKWYMNLTLALIKLYDQGYTDAIKDSEELQ